MQKAPITTQFIYTQCNTHQWFTCGSTSQYSKMFDMVEAGEPLEDIALVISICSDNVSKEAIIETLNKEREIGGCE